LPERQTALFPLSWLGNHTRSHALPDSAPALIITTPAGQLHELGAIPVGAAAVSQGWRVTYVGPNLPAEEIAGAAQQKRARAVALSVVYPEDDPHLSGELRRLGVEVIARSGLNANVAPGQVERTR